MSKIEIYHLKQAEEFPNIITKKLTHSNIGLQTCFPAMKATG
jgi:hypothetical protein